MCRRHDGSMVRNMSAPLNESERELISAYVDDEVTDDERRQVEAMLEREDAAQYLYEIRATRELAIEHARVPAPVGLKSRVMQKLKTRNAPPPAFQWSTAVYAAAAVLVVTLGIMFGPVLFSPAEETTPTVAREDLEEFRAGNDAEAESESAFGAPAPDDERARAEIEAETAQSDKEAGEEESEQLRGRVDSIKRRGAPESEGARDADAAAAKSGRDEAAPKDDAEAAQAGSPASTRESRGGLGGGIGGGVMERGLNSEIVIDAAGPAAENDVVWVSSLHGDVEFGDDAQGDYLSVTVAPDGVAGFRKALAKLARDQGYGNRAFADNGGGADITAYLPAPQRPAARRDGNNEGPVRVIVRLK